MASSFTHTMAPIPLQPCSVDHSMPQLARGIARSHSLRVGSLASPTTRTISSLLPKQGVGPTLLNDKPISPTLMTPGLFLPPAIMVRDRELEVNKLQGQLSHAHTARISSTVLPKLGAGPAPLLS